MITGVENTYCYEQNQYVVSEKCAGKKTIRVTFKNKAKEKVALQWYSESGVAKTFYELAPDSSKRYRVCPGHKWGFLNLATGKRY